jgi:hypothetical protein
VRSLLRSLVRKPRQVAVSLLVRKLHIGAKLGGFAPKSAPAPRENPLCGQFLL